MTTDLCSEAAIVHITTPQIITTESVVNVSSVGMRGPPAACGNAVELGRRLLLAARAGDTQLVLDLMAKGAPFTTDWLGTSPLHLAASNAHTETCGVLLRAGVLRDSRTKVERTPLHLAAYAGHAAVAALLLDYGALVDCRDMLRMTPLHWAAERGHAACVAVLLRHGADARLLSKFHKTPSQLAATKGHADVVALIDDALKQREAARSVRALVDRTAEETSTESSQRQSMPTVTRIQDIKIKPKPVQEKSSKAEVKEPTEAQGGGGGGGGGGGAAALLRRHGITLLPRDEGSTLLTALQSGRTVVLSDAGKLMLKESESPTVATAGTVQSPSPSVASVGSVTSVGSVGSVTSVGSVGTASSVGGVSVSAGGGRGVVLTATPVRAPPPGVKVFTLNNRVKPQPAAQKTQQIKFVQLGADTRVLSPRRSPRVSASAPSRPPVKIIMNKSNFERLVAGARLDLPEPAAATTDTTEEVDDSADTPTSIVITPDLPSGSVVTTAAEAVAPDAGALLAQLAAAQGTVAALAHELRLTRKRLARYEPD